MTKDKDIVCSKCGAKVSKDSTYCNVCGTKIDNYSQEEEVVVETVPRRGRPKKVVNKDNSEVVKEEKIEDNNINVEPNYNSYIYNESKKDKKSKLENKKKYIYPIIAVIVTFILCLGAFTIFYQYYLKNLVIETTKREVTITDTGISEAVEKVYDSVVVVESYVKDKLYATGTGFVYKTDDKNGYILTNSHVVEGAEEVRVVFTNNKREKVEVIGNDSYSDVALLAVDKEEVLAVADIGSSDALKLGDTAFAVGAPLDSATYAWTITRGIISGKNRNVEVSTGNGFQSSSYVMEVLQTDAAINNGNSGGPLCNSNGEVIGITNMKLASSTIEGMGFAIPIETATKIGDKFINGEKISYPYIGVSIYDAVPSYRNPDASGVYIESVEKNSPADKGGLKAGDKILEVNGKEVTSSSFFKFELYKYGIGDIVKITVERDNNKKTLEVKLGSQNMTT